MTACRRIDGVSMMQLNMSVVVDVSKSHSITKYTTWPQQTYLLQHTIPHLSKLTVVTKLQTFTRERRNDTLLELLKLRRLLLSILQATIVLGQLLFEMSDARAEFLSPRNSGGKHTC